MLYRLHIASKPFWRAGLIALGLLMAMGASTGCQVGRWERDPEDGLLRAVQQRRRALMYFHKLSCLDCARMEREVFVDPHVRELLRSYVPIQVDAVVEHDWAKRLEVQGTPTFVVVRPDTKVIARYEGPMDLEAFSLFLMRYSHD